MSGWFGFEPTFGNIVDGRLIAVFLKNENLREHLLRQNEENFSELYKDYLISAENVEHRVPFELLKRDSKIVLYGAGKRGQKYYRQLCGRRDYEIALWVDKNYKIYQEAEYIICAPE